MSIKKYKTLQEQMTTQIQQIKKINFSLPKIKLQLCDILVSLNVNQFYSHMKMHSFSCLCRETFVVDILRSYIKLCLKHFLNLVEISEIFIF